MKKINSEQSIAQAYLAWREIPPRLMSLLRKYVVLWTVLAILVLIGVAIAHIFIDQFDIGWFAPLALGLVVGAIARDIGWAHKFVMAWPFLKRLLDWQAVERSALSTGKPSVNETTPAPKSRPRRAAVIGLTVGIALLSLVLGADWIMLRMHDPRPSNAPGNVIIYTTAWCPYCEALRVQLRNSGIPYTELDVEKSLAASYAHRAVGGRGIPVTVVGQEVVYGLDRERLDSILRAAGHNPAAWTDATGRPVSKDAP
jgi:mycoredoxin